MKVKLKKLYLIASLVAGSSFQLAGATTWNLQGATYSVDTLYHAKIGPGITRTTLNLNGNNKQKIFYTTIDLKNSGNDIRVLRAANEAVGVKELSKMCADATTEDERYLVGINADFFDSSRPLGSVVMGGIPVFTSTSTTRHSWYITDTDAMGVGNISFKGTVTANGKSTPLSSINGGRSSGYLVLYTHHYGSSYNTNGLGSNVAVKFIEGSPAYRGHLKVQVTTNPSASTVPLSENQWALSGNTGEPDDFVKSLKPGDIVDLKFDTSLPVDGNIRELVGGLPVILEKGEVLPTPQMTNYEHLFTDNPRTAVGYDKNQSKVILLVVDGRTSQSVGCTTRVLADIMKNVGCYEALNLDGGGSSELYCNGFGVINSPSTGIERPVANSLWAVSTAPADTEVAEIAFEQFGTLSMPRFGKIAPRIYAYNRYGDLIDSNFKGYTLDCTESIGEISADGKTFFATGEGNGILTATYGSCKVSIPANIGGTVEPRILLSKVLVDNIHSFEIPLGATIGENTIGVAGAALQWSSDNTDIAIVSEKGSITGISEGTAIITGTNGTYTGTIEVNVELPSAKYVPIDLTASGWTLSKSGMNTASCSNDGNSLKINYNIKSARSASVTLKNETHLKAIPDSLRITFSAKAGSIKSMSLILTPASGKNVAGAVEYENNSEIVDASFSVAGIAGAYTDSPEAYPITFNSLKFDIQGNAGNSGNIEIEKIEAVYKDYGQTGINSIAADDLISISPNPASATAYIKGVEDGSHYSVFTSAGILAATGIAPTVNCSALASGLYFITVDGRTLRLIVNH